MNLISQSKKLIFYELKNNNLTIKPAHIICQSVYRLIMYAVFVSDSFKVPRDHVIRRYSKYTCLYHSFIDLFNHRLKLFGVKLTVLKLNLWGVKF